MGKNKEFKVDRLTIKVFDGRDSLGLYAANEVAEKIKELINKYDRVNIIFAAAPSQNEFLAALSQAKNVDWNKVHAFHMDEYVGLSLDAPQSFGQFLKGKIFNKVPFGAVYYLDDHVGGTQERCNYYAELLKKYPPDIVCMGIGENTHIAFNDPDVADFNDQELVKLVDLDIASRMQQVHDGCFTYLDAVPGKALTLTVPALMHSRYVFCMVPGKRKANAVYHTLNEEIKEDYPSTILREHHHATLYLDTESASELNSGDEGLI